MRPQRVFQATLMASVMALVFQLSQAANVPPEPLIGVERDATPEPFSHSRIALSNLKVWPDGSVIIEPENPDAFIPSDRLSDLEDGEDRPVICGSYNVRAGQYARVTSPEYPDNYHNRFKCAWKFISADDEELSFTCSEFSLARGDFLSISTDGVNSVKYRNQVAALADSTSGGVLELYFQTNKADTSSGFDCIVQHMGGESSTESSDSSSASTNSPPTENPTEEPQPNEECGRVKETRIVNGEVTEPNYYPWQVVLRIRMSNGPVYLCGGSIIHKKWVLTAAHCVETSAGVTASAQVYVGTHDRTNPGATGGYVVPGLNIFIHPIGWATHDIALIELRDELTFTETVGPVCLPPRSWASDDFAGKPVTMSGWGVTESGSTSTLLRHVDTVGYSYNLCRSFYGSWMRPTILCTDGSQIKHVCSGDSGGPVTTKAADDRRIQVGIVSFGASRSCNRDTPDGHVRLAAFIGWIEETTNLSFSR